MKREQPSVRAGAELDFTQAAEDAVLQQDEETKEGAPRAASNSSRLAKSCWQLASRRASARLLRRRRRKSIRTARSKSSCRSCRVGPRNSSSASLRIG